MSECSSGLFGSLSRDKASKFKASMKKDVAEIKEKIKAKEEEEEKRKKEKRKEEEEESVKEGCDTAVVEVHQHQHHRRAKKDPPLCEVLDPSPIYPAAHR